MEINKENCEKDEKDEKDEKEIRYINVEYLYNNRSLLLRRVLNKPIYMYKYDNQQCKYYGRFKYIEISLYTQHPKYKVYYIKKNTKPPFSRKLKILFYKPNDTIYFNNAYCLCYDFPSIKSNSSSSSNCNSSDKYKTNECSQTDATSKPQLTISTASFYVKCVNNCCCCCLKRSTKISNSII